MDAKSVEEFQEQIGIKFHEPSRLWNAFIHSSYANERRMSKDKNNERLEFLGDAVLELVTSNYLYRTYQKESEGKLSKIRASLVCEPTLCRMCKRYQPWEICSLKQRRRYDRWKIKRFHSF